ncbi:MAG TPA: GNAT family N-acetyltransferase [Pyrinomonadaceae bacterium]|nr:GNAT family N-acetyltransferase [Pyrinomonadaceae bacterium]
MDIRIRLMRQEDVETCGRICYEAFKSISEKHGFPPDFPSPDVAAGLLSHLLSHGDVYAIVAEDGGRVVGSNFLWETAAIAGVGPITVDPSVQNGAIGRRLMHEVITRAEERLFAGVRLVQAAYHNRSLSLYTKLGFDAREPLSAMQGEPLQIVMPGRDVRAATRGDVEACNRLHVRIHGYERLAELAEAIKQGTATVVEQAGRITGYATQLGFLGHAVAESNEDMKALIGAAKSFDGPGFLVPTRNSDLFRWCLEKGLRVLMPMTLMSTGLYNEPKGAFLPSVIY